MCSLLHFISAPFLKCLFVFKGSSKIELACDGTSHPQKKRKKDGNSISATKYKELKIELPALANKNIEVKFKFCVEHTLKIICCL